MCMQVIIHTDSIDTAGEMISDMCASLNLNDLASGAEFPELLGQAQDLMAQVGRVCAMTLSSENHARGCYQFTRSSPSMCS